MLSSDPVIVNPAVAQGGRDRSHGADIEEVKITRFVLHAGSSKLWLTVWLPTRNPGLANACHLERSEAKSRNPAD